MSLDYHTLVSHFFLFWKMTQVSSGYRLETDIMHFGMSYCRADMALYYKETGTMLY